MSRAAHEVGLWAMLPLYPGFNIVLAWHTSYGTSRCHAQPLVQDIRTLISLT